MSVKRIEIYYIVTSLTMVLLFPFIFVNMVVDFIILAYFSVLEYTYYCLRRLLGKFCGKEDFKLNWVHRLLMNMFQDKEVGDGAGR